MNKKIWLIIILFVPILLISLWVYFILNVWWSKQADITSAKETDKKNDTQNMSGVATKDIALDKKEETTKDTKTKTITLYMPSFFDNKWFSYLKKKLAKDYKLTVKTKIYKNMESFKKDLRTKLDKKEDNVDLFLVPSIRLDSLKEHSYKLNFGDTNVAGFFNYIFEDYINNEEYTFIPYAIDPFLIYIKKNNLIEKNTLTFPDIKENILISKQEKYSKIKIPLLFWISNLDIALVKGNNWAFNNYFLILYALLYQSKQDDSKEYIEWMMDLSQNNNLKARDYKKFKNLVTTFSKKNTSCKDFPNICILSYDFAKINLWLLSDMDIMDKYFASNVNKSSDFTYYNFLWNGEDYPVLARWFLVNKNTKNFDAAAIFLQEYIKQATSWNAFFWNNTLSAFNNILDKQRNETKYDKIMLYLNKFKILDGSMDMQKDFVKNTKVIEMLNW